MLTFRTRFSSPLLHYYCVSMSVSVYVRVLSKAVSVYVRVLSKAVSVYVRVLSMYLYSCVLLVMSVFFCATVCVCFYMFFLCQTMCQSDFGSLLDQEFEGIKNGKKPSHGVVHFCQPIPYPPPGLWLYVCVYLCDRGIEQISKSLRYCGSKLPFESLFVLFRSECDVHTHLPLSSLSWHHIVKKDFRV